jgi:hypothetical protein
MEKIFLKYFGKARSSGIVSPTGICFSNVSVRNISFKKDYKYLLTKRTSVCIIISGKFPTITGGYL